MIEHLSACAQSSLIPGTHMVIPPHPLSPPDSLSRALECGPETKGSSEWEEEAGVGTCIWGPLWEGGRLRGGR